MGPLIWKGVGHLIGHLNWLVKQLMSLKFLLQNMSCTSYISVQTLIHMFESDFDTVAVVRWCM